MTGGWSLGATMGSHEPALFDPNVAHCARVYDYWLGGKDNFAADRAAGDEAIRAFPNIVVSARANRAYLARAVRFLASDAGIRQFLDIGTGIPTDNNAHEVAQFIAPESRVFYVDNDPIVLTHARALLASHSAGATDYLEADLRDPQRILNGAAALLDFSRPVALMLMAILQHVDDDDNPAEIVARLMGSLPPGSYLALSHPASDIDAEPMARLAERLNQLMPEKLIGRSRSEVAQFFEGLELVEPGVVPVTEWRPAAWAEAASPAALWAGVARKN